MPYRQSDEYVEFALETFGWSSTKNSRIGECSRFAKSKIRKTTWLTLEMDVQCEHGFCSVQATLEDSARALALAAVSENRLILKNPGDIRTAWIGLLNAAGGESLQVEILPNAVVHAHGAGKSTP